MPLDLETWSNEPPDSNPKSLTSLPEHVRRAWAERDRKDAQLKRKRRWGYALDVALIAAAVAVIVAMIWFVGGF